MTFVHGKALTDQLRACLTGRRIDIAVAFWGAGAYELLNLAAAKPGSRIICDAYSGACNPDVLKSLLEAGFDVRFLDGLHAKVYISDAMAVVGSANASANGLSKEGGEFDIGLEACLVTTDATHLTAAKDWFESILQKSSKLTQSDLNSIKRLWISRRQNRPVQGVKTRTLIQAIRDEDTCLLDRRFFFVVYEPETPPDDVVNIFKETPYYDDATYDPDFAPYFWDAKGWNAQVGDLILSFEVENYRVEFDGMCQVQARIAEGFILPVETINKPLGLSFSDSQGAQIARLIGAAAKAGRIKIPTIGLLPISQLSPILGGRLQE